MVIMAMEIVPVGVILDLNSTVGEIAESCISMAVSDFYAVNDDFKTRLALFTRDSSRDVVAATSSGICVNSHNFLSHTQVRQEEKVKEYEVVQMKEMKTVVGKEEKEENVGLKNLER
ncbi:hypothetical protein DKX38_028332 [Salix brachista]|uniref:Uncharacterized protein n=1 Tax=Salix brachista TaxID=2182728 RepID=A0A5N5J778_9ROSI|nr:hypothetical protein DKX38_028332 [Salix brachista]